MTFPSGPTRFARGSMFSIASTYLPFLAPALRAFANDGALMILYAECRVNADFPRCIASDYFRSLLLTRAANRITRWPGEMIANEDLYRV